MDSFSAHHQAEIYFFSHPFISILTLYFLSYFKIIVHETGHYIFLKIYNLKPNSFTIGNAPFYFFKTSSGMLFRFGLKPKTGAVEFNFTNSLTIFRFFMIYIAGFLFEIVAYLYVYYQFLHPFWGVHLSNSPLINTFFVFSVFSFFFAFSSESDFYKLVLLIFKRQFVASGKRYQFKRKIYSFGYLCSLFSFLSVIGISFFLVYSIFINGVL